MNGWVGGSDFPVVLRHAVLLAVRCFARPLASLMWLGPRPRFFLFLSQLQFFYAVAAVCFVTHRFPLPDVRNVFISGRGSCLPCVNSSAMIGKLSLPVLFSIRGCTYL